jgi:hypothetical protein
MAGLLDLFGGEDPQQQGLLGLTAGILGASGPSRMPVSLGQVLGTGLGGFQQARKDALDRQREQAQMDMLQQQVAQATRKNALINNFLAGTLGGGQSSDASGPSSSAQTISGAPSPSGMSAPTPASAPSAGGNGFGGVPSTAIAADLAFNNGQKIGEWVNDRSKPTDFTKLLTQAGIDPSSTLGRQIIQQQIAKQNNIPLVSGRAGAPMYNPDGSIAAMAPIIPKNSVPQIVNGKVVGVSPLTGAAGVEQINSYADQAGKNQAEPLAAYDGSGQPVFTNRLKAASGEPMPGQPGFDVTHMSSTQKKAFYDAAAKQFSLRPGSTPNTSTIRPGLAPGVEKSISGNVDTMNQDFSDLYAANKNAPVTLAILDNIKKLAPKAITGTSADKLAYMNGLLTIGGLQPAKDVASATDLLNKNANMLAINMRLGANGGGSDALQALAQAANPNSHMQPDAIIKAADEVIGQIKMRQGMYQQLLPYKMNNDVQGYYGAQRQISSNADPRTFQPDAGAQPAAQPAPQAGQKKSALPGQVVRGYRFKGGDPSKQENWEKVQ